VDKPSPQLVGTVVTFTATASGAGSFEYRFWVAKGAGAFAPVGSAYSADRALAWTPTAADSYRVMVYARALGSAVAFEKSATRSGYYAVAEAPVTAVTLSATKASPQQVGTALTFTGAAAGGGASGVEYQFWLARGGGAFRVVKDYAVAGASWTPVAGDMDAADKYVVKVNARTVNSVAPFEKTASKEYVLMADPPVKSVSLSADKPSPQDIATVGEVTFTAVAVPGVPRSAVEYQFWLYTTASAKYVAVGDATTDFSSANTWHWTPAAVDDYRVMVYARTAGSTVAYEKLKVIFYSVFAAPPQLGDVTPSVVSSPADAARSFSAVYSDVDGYEGLKTADILVNDTATEAGAIFARYDRTLGKFYLTNDAGTAYVGNCLPGSAVTLTNSQGSLNCAASSATGAGNDLTVVWSLTPKAAFVSATPKNIFTHAKDTANVMAGWTDKGDWTIGAVDFADCVGCHGNPPNAGANGGAGADAPNVMGNGTSAAGTGSTPKPYDDGTWGYNVNGHGANGTAGVKVDTDDRPTAVNYLNPNDVCSDCHLLQSHHYDGVLDSASTGSRKVNTYHLKTDGPFPFVNAAAPDDHTTQVTFDDACFNRCHYAALGMAGDMRHWGQTVPEPVFGISKFGNAGTVQDGDTLAWPIDSDISTRASGSNPDYLTCSTCHNVHGTPVVRNGYPSNRMLRQSNTPSAPFCGTCHL
jgi:hypothetical protein